MKHEQFYCEQRNEPLNKFKQCPLGSNACITLKSVCPCLKIMKLYVETDVGYVKGIIEPQAQAKTEAKTEK